MIFPLNGRESSIWIAHKHTVQALESEPCFSKSNTLGHSTLGQVIDLDRAADCRMALDIFNPACTALV